MMSRSVGKNGFSLVEVMITAVILLIVIGSLLLTFVQCIILNENNEDVAHAVNDAQMLLERVRAHAFADISSYCNNFVPDGNFTGLSGEIADCVIESSGTNWIEINATVQWVRRTGVKNVWILSTFSTAQ